MTLNGVMAVILRYFTEFGKHAFQLTHNRVDLWRNLCTSLELFLATCYGWGTTSDYLLKIGDFAPTGVGWPKISGRRGEGVAPPPPTILLLRKLYDKCSLVWYKNLDRSFFRFVTIHACDRRTDGRTDGRTDRQTDRQNSPRYTASALNAAR